MSYKSSILSYYYAGKWQLWHIVTLLFLFGCNLETKRGRRLANPHLTWMSLTELGVTVKGSLWNNFEMTALMLPGLQPNLQQKITILLKNSSWYLFSVHLERMHKNSVIHVQLGLHPLEKPVCVHIWYDVNHVRLCLSVKLVAPFLGR